MIFLCTQSASHPKTLCFEMSVMTFQDDKSSEQCRTQLSNQIMDDNPEKTLHSNSEADMHDSDMLDESDDEVDDVYSEYECAGENPSDPNLKSGDHDPSHDEDGSKHVFPNVVIKHPNPLHEVESSERTPGAFARLRATSDPVDLEELSESPEKSLVDMNPNHRQDPDMNPNQRQDPDRNPPMTDMNPDMSPSEITDLDKFPDLEDDSDSDSESEDDTIDNFDEFRKKCGYKSPWSPDGRQDKPNLIKYSTQPPYGSNVELDSIMKSDSGTFMNGRFPNVHIFHIPNVGDEWW